VLDDKGLIGQTTHVGPFSAEVILITDPEHAVPVQIDRTGLRTIAVGTGDTASLALPYLPANADVKAGDVLTTSGLGGVFPAGYPVGRVVEVHRDAVQPLAQVRAEPFATLNTDREVMLVWFREGHPAAPVLLNGSDAKTGNANMQSQPVPPRKAPPPAPTPAAAPAAPSPGDAAATPTQAKPPAPKPAKPAPEPKDDAEEGPPTEEDVPPKPEPKSGTAPPASAPPKANAPQATNQSPKTSASQASSQSAKTGAPQASSHVAKPAAPQSAQAKTATQQAPAATRSARAPAATPAPRQQ
jgi:rod shape-determining protein MreC